MVEKYGWDQTPTPDLGLDITKAPEDIQKLYKWVIQKTYGQDVASAYGQGLIAAGIIAKNAEAMSLFTSGRMDDLHTFVDNMLLEMTDKDVISAPEIIFSRDGEATLSDRLDRDNLLTNSRLDYVEDNLIGQSLNSKFRGAGQNLMFKESEIGYSFQTMLDKLISVNANTVAICPSFWVDNDTSQITGYKDEPYVSDDIIFNYAKSAKEKGLTVVLKPHVNGENFTSFYSINPADYVLFINNYSNKLVQLATKCKDYVDIISITNEMDRQTKTNRNLWIDLINQLRLINPNFKLTNSSRTDDLETNVFLDQLDYIGWNCYLNIGDNLTQTVGEQERNMLMRKDDVNKALSKSVELDKPILITEIGTQAYQTGLSNPESWIHSGEGDYDYQIRYYNVVLRTLLRSERVIGTIIWTAAGIPSGFGFDFLGKEKVELAVKEIYGG